MTSQPRPVWITEDSVNAVVSLLHSMNLAYASKLANELEDAYKTAPADAAEAAVKAIRTRMVPEPIARQMADLMLRALGYPHTEHACKHDWKAEVFGGTDGWRCSKCGAIQ